MISSVSAFAVAIASTAKKNGSVLNRVICIAYEKGHDRNAQMVDFYASYDVVGIAAMFALVGIDIDIFLLGVGTLSHSARAL